MSLPKLLLLHGAIGAKDQLEPLKNLLQDKYEVYAMSFIGHGSRPQINEDFSIRLFAEDVLSFLNSNNIDSANIFGYSMGGYVAMYLAKNYPQKVDKVVTLGTKFNWNEEIAAKEIKLLDADKIAQKIPKFAETLKQRHSVAGWRSVLDKTKQLLISLGADNTLKLEDYTSINNDVIILLADQDDMVSEKESEAVVDRISNGIFGWIKNSQHPIEKVDISNLLPYFA